jgi:hypothetical protein
MKNIIVLTVFIACGYFFSHCGQKKTGFHKTKTFNGNIKVCKQKDYTMWPTDGKSEPMLGGITIALYDKKGNETENYAFLYVKLLYKTIYKYDDKDHEIERICFAKNNSLHYRSEYIYDKDGNNTKILRYNSKDSLETSTIYKYNGKGQVIERVHYDSDGNMKDKATYILDKAGNVIEGNYFGPKNDNLPEKSISKYDSSGNLAECSSFNADGSLIKTEKWTFDDRGNWIEIHTYNSDGSEHKSQIEYVYDQQGNWIKETIINDDGTIFGFNERELVYY